jgi:flavin reductase (DIM6/NTAB) family NADH-FMN oxidoreductase RutF
MEERFADITIDEVLWDRFYLPYSLVVIGSKEKNAFDLAPKHMAMPLGWENYFGFVCTPRHATYKNIKKHGTFTVSFPKVDQLAFASLAASPRSKKENEKVILKHIETIPAEIVDGVFLKDSILMFECNLHKIYDDFGKSSLISGKIIKAKIDIDYLRVSDINDQLLIYNHPILSYLYPDRYAIIKETVAFPFPKGFKK